MTQGNLVNNPPSQSEEILPQVLLLKQMLDVVIKPEAAQLLQAIQPGAAQLLQKTIPFVVTESIDKIVPGTVKHSFQDLTNYQKADLYNRLELNKALTVNNIQSEDIDLVISKAFKTAISWTLNTRDSSDSTASDDTDPFKNIYHPNWSVPRKIGYLTVESSTSVVSRAVAKFVSKGTSTQELSMFSGLEANVNNETSASSSLNVQNKTYLLAEYTRPKLTLSVDWDNIKLNDDFKNKIEKILDQDEWSSFVELNYLLKEYGYFVPLQFTIGGNVCAQTEVKSEFSSDSQVKTSFESSFASRLNFSSAQGSGETNASAKTESNQNMFSQSDMKIEYYGGVGPITNIFGWIKSLDCYKAWQVIKYSNLVPIICFFHGEYRNKAIRAFIRYSYYPNTNKPLFINGINYASRALDLINTAKFLPDLLQDSQKTTPNKNIKVNKVVQLLSYQQPKKELKQSSEQ